MGGIWWANTYPGCRCDIPSHLYSFSFAPNPDFARMYAPQPEIESYIPEGHRPLRDPPARQDRLRGHERHLGGPTKTAGTSPPRRASHRRRPHRRAPGPLSAPSIPALPGLDTFARTTFHTANWRHDHDPANRRAAVIGTGASAIQAVPEIQPLVESLTIFERTAPWVVPHRDRPITAAERRLDTALPPLQRAVRAGVYLGRELLVPGLAYRPKLMGYVEKPARRHLERQVADPALRAKLTPGYTIGCQRILPSNKWYPAVTQPNVELVTDGIDHVRPDGIVARTGDLDQVDTIVFATGFHVTDVPLSHVVTGDGGCTLAEQWDGSPQTYRGTTVAGFANLFIRVGPNTGLGHNSTVFMIEAHLAYVIDALEHMRARGATRVAMRPEAQRAHNERLQARLARSVWNTGGCSSWYLDRNGNNSTIWPDFTVRFWRRMRRFDPRAYELTTSPAAARPRRALRPHRRG